MALLEALDRFRHHWGLLALLLVPNVVGILFGYYYYWQVGQFNPASDYYVHWAWWPLVADSPNAVFVCTVALVAARLGRRSRLLDAAGFVLMLYVGLWTTLLFLLYPDTMGTWEWGSTNNLLFWSHLGMPLEALVLLPALRRDAWHLGHAAILVAAAATYVAVDYGWPHIHPAPFLHDRLPQGDGALHVGSLILMAGAVGLSLVAVTRQSKRPSAEVPA